MTLAIRIPKFMLVLSGVLALSLGLFACQSDEEKLVGFIERGDQYSEEEQFDEAIIEYRNALQIDPNFVDAHQGLYKAYMKTGKFREGYWELSETVRLAPENVEARLGYAGVSLAARRYEEVLEQAEAIIELDPENPAGYLLRGQAKQSLGRPDEVEVDLIRAVELEPEDASYRLVMAAYFQSQKRWDEALEQLDLAIELDPQPLQFTTLAHIQTARGGHEAEAEAALMKALELASEQSEDGELSADVALGYKNLARFYFTRDEPREEEGLAMLEKGVVASDYDTDLVRMLHIRYREEEEFDKANALMEAAAKQDPTDVRPWLTLSSLRSDQDDFDGALEAAEAAVAADPTHIQARLRVAELLIDVGHRENDEEKMSRGRAIVDEVLLDQPSSPEGLFVRAKLHIADGEYDEAVEVLRSSIDAKPDWAHAHYLLGTALVLTDDKQRARAMLARAVELDPKLYAARQLLVKVHVQLNEWEYAVDNGMIYLQAIPENDEIRILVAQSLMRLGKTDEAETLIEPIPEEKRGVDVLYALGRIRLAQGKLEPARELLLQAGELKPNNPKVLSALFAIDRATGRLADSVKRLDDAVEAEPEVSGLWYIRGLVSLDSRDVAKAEASFKQAIELNPNRLDAYQQLARVYQGTGRGDEMLRVYEQAVEAQPESAPPHHFLGVLYEMRGRTAEAKEQYELAIKYDTGLGESKNNLAYILAEEGTDLDRSLKLAQEAKAAMPDSPNAADTLGWVLYKRGVASAAVGYLREAVQLSDPDDPGRGEILNHLAAAYEAAGQNDKAIEALDQALGEYERLKEKGLSSEPPWAATARTNMERLKAAG